MPRLLVPAAIALCGITLSIYFTVQLLSVTFAVPLAIAVGVLLGAGQFYATARAASRTRNVLITILYGLSITATALQLEKTASADMARLNADKAQSITTAITASDAYRLTHSAITSIDAEIASVQTLIDADIATHYRQRANARRNDLAALRDKRTALLAQLTQTQTEAVALTPHMYDAVSDHYRQLVLFLIAVMIEAVTAMGLLDVLRARRVAPVAAPVKVKRAAPVKKPVVRNTAEMTVEQYVLQHPVGEVLSARKVSAAAKVSQRRVAVALTALQQQGITKKENGRWMRKK